MNKIVGVISLLMLLVTVGARGNDLVGIWKLDHAEGERANQTPPSLSYRFNPDGSSLMSAIGKNGLLNETEWTYSVINDQVRMKLVNSKKLDEVFQYFIAGDVLTMKHRDSRYPVLVFRRSQ
jgi:hypothetical protein